MTADPLFWIDRPVAVTGATGLVGTHLVRRLVDRGADVVCLIRDRVPRSLLFKSPCWAQVRVVYGDIRDQAVLERLLNEYEVRSVFHLAAQAIVSTANRNAVSTFESNIGGTWSLLEACRRCPTVKDVVVASSDKAYGSHDELPYDETTPLEACHPYDASKACSDILAKTYAYTYDLPVAVTRCGNFYGPGDLNWNRIIPGTIRSLLRGQRPIIRSDGQHVRDYFYVEDGAAAYMALAEKLSRDRGLRGEAFNFSNEEPMTVLDVVGQIADTMSVGVKPVVQNEATNEIREQYLCAAKARRVLGWRPTFSFQRGLEETISWYRGHLIADRVIPENFDVSRLPKSA